VCWKHEGRTTRWQDDCDRSRNSHDNNNSDSARRVLNNGALEGDTTQEDIRFGENNCTGTNRTGTIVFRCCLYVRARFPKRREYLVRFVWRGIVQNLQIAFPGARYFLPVEYVVHVRAYVFSRSICGPSVYGKRPLERRIPNRSTHIIHMINIRSIYVYCKGRVHFGP